MKLFECWVEGTTPLLMHRFGEVAEGNSGKNTRRIQVANKTPREEAEAVAYREPSGELYMPGAAISRLLREAGGAHKQRGSRKSMKFVIPSCVLVTHETIPLFDMTRKTRLSDYEVDSRPVVIPATKGRIMRHRPRLDSWTGRFTLRVNEDLIDPKLVHQLIVEGGMQLGLGDFRPEKGGSFGCFAVVSWSEPKASAGPTKKAA